MSIASLVFPHWVDKGSKAKRASNRLRFICYSLSLQVADKPSMSGLAKVSGYDHSTIACYIKRGHCSQEFAAKLEAYFSDQVILADWLLNPLEIPAA